MKTHSFPFDKESCAIKFQSYAYPFTEVKYKWKPHPNGTLSIVRRRLADINFVFAKPLEKQKNTEFEGEVKSHLGFRMFFGNEITFFKRFLP